MRVLYCDVRKSLCAKCRKVDLKVKVAACYSFAAHVGTVRLDLTTSTFADKMEDITGGWRQLRNENDKICSDPPQHLIELSNRGTK